MTEHEVELVARRIAELIRPEEPWLSKAEIARHFGCSTRSIEIAMKDGLPYRPMFGRSKFRASEVQGWLDSKSDDVGLSPEVDGPAALPRPGPGQQEDWS